MQTSKSPTGKKATTRRGYVDGPFGQVHYREHGSGVPLLLLHQAPMTSEQFDYVYEPLARHGIRAIGIDMPGFGGSDPTVHTPGVADYAQVVPAVLDGLGLSRAAILGHHTGALVATEAAVVYPDRIDALVINGPLLVTPALHDEFLQGLHAWELQWSARENAGHMAELFGIRDELAHGAISHERLSDYVVQALSGRGAFWWGHHAAYTYDQAARLPLVTQPAMILTNTGDMIHDHALAAHRLRPDFTLTSLEGSGIDVVDELPEEWADAVARFISRTAHRSEAK